MKMLEIFIEYISYRIELKNKHYIINSNKSYEYTQNFSLKGEKIYFHMY